MSYRNEDRLTNQRQIRSLFWRLCSDIPGVSRRRLRDGDYNATTRVAFVDFVDALEKEGQISERLASQVTLN